LVGENGGKKGRKQKTASASGEGGGQGKKTSPVPGGRLSRPRKDQRHGKKIERREKGKGGGRGRGSRGKNSEGEEKGGSEITSVNVMWSKEKLKTTASSTKNERRGGGSESFQQGG